MGRLIAASGLFAFISREPIIPGGGLAEVRCAPIADQIPQRNEMTRWAMATSRGPPLLPTPLTLSRAQPISRVCHCAGAGIGKMLDTFQPPLGVLTSTRFIRNRVGCAGWPGAPIVKRIGT